MKITAKVNKQPQEQQKNPYYIDDNPTSDYYGKVYILVHVISQHLFAAVSLTGSGFEPDLVAVGNTRCGWRGTAEDAISGGGLSPLTPILPPRTITIEIEP